MGMVLAVLLTSCYEDKGNYDYDWVTDVRIENLKDTLVSRGEVLKIEPQLSLILGDSLAGESFNPEDYEYLWTTGFESDATILSRERVLNDTIWLPISETAYTVFYRISRKSSGLFWYGKFNLSVKGRYSKGILFLTEDENKQVELDLYGNTPTGEWILEKGALARSGFPYRGGGANCVYSQTVANAKRIWVATGEATGWLDMKNFAWGERDIARSIMAIPQPVSYTFKNIITLGGKVYLMSADGNGHVINNYAMIYPTFAVVNNKTVKLAPFAVGTTSSAAVWDLTNRQLVLNLSDNMMTANAYCEELAAENALKGMEFVYMQEINNTKFVLIVREPVTGKFWKYRYAWERRSRVYYPVVEDNGVEELKEMEILEGVEPEMMGVDRANGYFYFAIGNKLYNYRSGGGFDKPVECNLTFKDPITRVQVTNNGYQQYLWVATYDSSKGDTGGTVYKLKVNSTNSQEVTVDGEPVTGLGRVRCINFW